jgi:hypothetical protein
VIEKLQNFRIKTQLLLLEAVMLAGFIAFGVMAFFAVMEIKVKVPVYQMRKALEALTRES